MIFGSTHDAKLMLHIRRELLHDIVEQEILFYKAYAPNSVSNIYGEAPKKAWLAPIHLTCLIKRGDQSWDTTDYGGDVDRTTSFAFIKEDLVNTETMETVAYPEVGDVIEWHKNYFLIDEIKENQLWFGKDPWYRIEDIDPDRTQKFGESVSIVCGTHLTRYKKLNIVNLN